MKCFLSILFCLLLASCGQDTLNSKTVKQTVGEQVNPNPSVDCTAVYEPICAHPPMPECPAGVSCPAVLPDPETYPNQCEMGKAGAHFLYYGECSEDGTMNNVDCPAVYEPVCAHPPMPECPAGVSCPTVLPDPETYSNRCEMGKAEAHFLYDGECS